MAQAELSRRPVEEGAAVPPVSANPLIGRLESLVRLSQRERAALLELLHAWEWAPPGAILEREGDPASVVHVLLGGLACRYKDFRDGRRQIIAILFPGDVSRHPASIARPPDHHVRALTRAKVVKIPAQQLQAIIAGNPGIERAWHAASIAEGNVLRAWIVNLGQRQAHERLAHLFCEIAHRMIEGNLSRRDGGFELPLTQKDLGTALGLTSVHVNRVLQRLRGECLLEFANGVLHIHDLPRLEHIANFDPTYLSG